MTSAKVASPFANNKRRALSFTPKKPHLLDANCLGLACTSTPVCDVDECPITTRDRASKSSRYWLVNFQHKIVISDQHMHNATIGGQAPKENILR